MAALDEFDKVLEQLPAAVDEFVKGNPRPTQELFSHEEDVTLANPLGRSRDRPHRAWMGAGCSDPEACRIAVQRW